jgi:hypothetical protein
MKKVMNESRGASKDGKKLLRLIRSFSDEKSFFASREAFFKLNMSFFRFVMSFLFQIHLF